MRLRRVVPVAIVLWAGAVIVAAVAGRPASPMPPRVSALTSSVPAQQVRRLEITAGRGLVTIGAAPGDTVDFAVEVSSGAAGPALVRGPQADAALATIESAVRGDTLTARLGGTYGSGLTERWTVRVPARLAADVVLDRGEIAVSGVEGGVRARTQSGVNGAPGRIVVDVPRGALDLSMGVGKIDAHTDEAPRGAIDVRSTVGHATLTLDGREIVTDQAPGPGQRARLSGADAGGIVVRVSVGDARVRVR